MLGICYIAYHCMTLLHPDSAASLLVDPGRNIYTVSSVLFPLLTSRSHTFNEAIDWIKSTFTGDRTGAYFATDTTNLRRKMVTDGRTIFAYAISTLLM